MLLLTPMTRVWILLMCSELPCDPLAQLRDTDHEPLTAWNGNGQSQTVLDGGAP
jgi:hypothetical protein